MPFVWQALTAACIGLVVVLVGVGLCIIGYHADRLMSIMHDDTPLQPRHLNNYNDYDNNSEVNGTETVWAQLAGTYIHLKYLIYLGPALMSCGSFAIVFSCVVVCETRDKALQLIEQREQAGIHGAKAFRGVKLDFFNSVVNPRGSCAIETPSIKRTRLHRLLRTNGRRRLARSHRRQGQAVVRGRTRARSRPSWSSGST